MSSDLLNKVSVVTGGCGLLGQEHCEALIEKGAIVYSGDINLLDSKRFENNENYKEIYLDVTSEKSVKSVLKNIIDKEKKN